MANLLHPFYYRVFVCRSGKWSLYQPSNVYRLSGQHVDIDDFEATFNISKWRVVTELFRLNGGRDGYYIANLKDKAYYYCGIADNDVASTFQQLGISPADPMEGKC